MCALGRRHLTAQGREVGWEWLRFGGRGRRGLRPERAADIALCRGSALPRAISVRRVETALGETKAALGVGVGEGAAGAWQRLGACLLLF